MSNIFLSTALLTLAQKEANCYDDDLECGTVHGYKPSSLITIIGTISGLLSALFLPLIGSIVDTTPYRRRLGLIACTFLISVQAIQIGTTQDTWFYMAILQSINGFIFQIVLLIGYSYLPEIGRTVGGEVMNKYSAEWNMTMFGSELMYLLVVIVLSIKLGLDDAETGQLGQAINVPTSGMCYYLAWKFFTSKGASRKVSAGESVIWSGFKQVAQTSSAISRHYGASLGWFLLGVIFSEAASGAFVLVAVSYLKEVLGFSGNEIGILFFVVIFSTIPGSLFGSFVTKNTCPKTSMKLQLVTFCLVNFAGFMSLTEPGQENLAFFYGMLWGLLLGWFYTTESLIFSMVVPKGQEAELAGFFLYCSQILSWLPPLVFTYMNEQGFPLKWGGIHLNVYLIIALICYQIMLPWDECVAAVQVNQMLPIVECGRNGNSRDGIEMADLASQTIQVV